MLSPSGSLGVGLYVGLVLLIAMGRLLELRLSRRRLAALSPQAFACDTRGTWPAMVALHVALLILPLAEVLQRGRLLVPALFWPSTALIGAATLLRLWTQRSLGPAWNARGFVDPELGFSTAGPYRFCRHPNYLAVLVEVLAIPMAGSAWISLVVLAPAHIVVLFRRISAEDRALATLPGYNQAFEGHASLWPARHRTSLTSNLETHNQ